MARQAAGVRTELEIHSFRNRRSPLLTVTALAPRSSTYRKAGIRIPPVPMLIQRLQICRAIYERVADALQVDSRLILFMGHDLELFALEYEGSSRVLTGRETRFVSTSLGLNMGTL